MKKYISVLVMALCVLTMNVKAGSSAEKAKSSAECECCKNCKDDKCKELCKKYNSMSADVKKSAEGVKVKEECMKLCKEKKCCTAAATATCEKEGKTCCKKK